MVKLIFIIFAIILFWPVILVVIGTVVGAGIVAFALIADAVPITLTHEGIRYHQEDLLCKHVQPFFPFYDRRSPSF